MNKILEKLQNRLKRDLPGLESQLKMAPERKIKMTPESEKYQNSAVIVLLVSSHNLLHLVLIKRSEYDGHHSGQISFPGGKQEDEDSSLKDTALREAEEELGVHQNDIQVIGQLTPLYIAISRFMVYPFVAFINSPVKFIPQVGEVEYIVMVSLNDLFLENTIKKATICRSNYSFITPYFDVQGEIVWGATAMILSEFRDILKECFISD